MANKRILYATKKVGIGTVGSAGGSSSAKGSFTQMHGIQSVGITTTFNLEQTFELGQLSIYENIEGIPDISIDVEKVLDGYCPVYVMATSRNGSTTTGVDGKATAATLIGRSKAQCDFCLSIYKDTAEIATNTAAGGASDAAETDVMMSGVFVNSVSYNVGIEGYATETVNLVGENKIWHNHSTAAGTVGGRHKRPKWAAADFISGEESPLALTQGSGGVNRREDVIFDYPERTGTDARGTQAPGGFDVNGAVSGLGTILPRQLPGISTSGTNDRWNSTGGAHIQSFSCSTDFGREDIFELGKKGRFHRFVPFPTEVTSEITIISQSGDLISATEAGVVDKANQANLNNESIRLQLREGLIVDLGTKNKLSNVSVTGGDAGGGNEEITYSYSNFNNFTVYHPQDPLFLESGDAGYQGDLFTPIDGRGGEVGHENSKYRNI